MILWCLAPLYQSRGKRIFLIVPFVPLMFRKMAALKGLSVEYKAKMSAMAFKYPFKDLQMNALSSKKGFFCVFDMGFSC